KLAFEHLAHEVGELDLVMPAQALARLWGIAEQPVGLGRPEISRIDGDEQGTIAGVVTLFVDTPPAPRNLAADLGEGELDELTHRMRLAGGLHIVIRLILLQDGPHSLGEVAGMAPVPLPI